MPDRIRCTGRTRFEMPNGIAHHLLRSLAEPHAWYKVLATVPAAAAFPPNGVCHLVP